MDGIKPQKNSPRMPLKELNSSSETRDERTPVYFYNKFIRKEGQPILTEIEYNIIMKAHYNRRKKEPGETQFILIDEIEISEEMKKQVAGYQALYDNTMKEIGKYVGIPEDKQGEPDART